MANRQRTKGTSLAKGPVGLIGLALLAYGITALIFGGHGFTHHALTGAVDGKTWLGLEVNGWSGLLFVAAGLLLLLGAPMHCGAKGISLIVGIALAVLCLIALANGHGALGIFAANGLTELVWGAAGALLIVLSLLPRVGGETKHGYEHSAPIHRASSQSTQQSTATRPVSGQRASIDRDRPLPARPTAVPSLPFRTRVTKATTPPSTPANQPGAPLGQFVELTSTNSHIDSNQGAIA